MTHIDTLVAAKICAGDATDRCYSRDWTDTLVAVDHFTRRGGCIRLSKSGPTIWESAASLRPRGKIHASHGPSAAYALCRAMLAASGVDIMSSDGG